MADSISWGQVPEGFDKIRSGGRMALVRGDMATHLDLQRLRDTEVEDNGVFGRGARAGLRPGGAPGARRPRWRRCAATRPPLVVRRRWGEREAGETGFSGRGARAFPRRDGDRRGRRA